MINTLFISKYAAATVKPNWTHSESTQSKPFIGYSVRMEKISVLAGAKYWVIWDELLVSVTGIKVTKMTLCTGITPENSRVCQNHSLPDTFDSEAWYRSKWSTSATDRFDFRDYTSQQDFGTRKVYCVSNVTFHAESKYVIKIFPSPTVFVQWPFKLLIFRNFWYFNQWFFYTWTNILNGFEQRVVTYNLPLSYF